MLTTECTKPSINYIVRGLDCMVDFPPFPARKTTFMTSDCFPAPTVSSEKKSTIGSNPYNVAVSRIVSDVFVSDAP